MTSPRRTTSVGLVDDQQLVRAGFNLVLESQDDITVEWQANDGEEARTLAAAHPVDVILMDVQMPRLNGLTATREILATGVQGPSGDATRIVMLTTFDNDSYVLGSVEAGASGFLLKDADPEELIAAVRTVGESAAVISPKATAKLLRRMRASGTPDASPLGDQHEPAPPAPDVSAPPQQKEHETGEHLAPEMDLPDPLTPRETEILILMAKGRSNVEISQDLFISLPTVKTHVGRVLSKTGSRDRVHAVLFAFRHGLVDGDSVLNGD